MKKILILFAGILCLCWANQTRMNTLMAGDYIDDPVNISVFPQYIPLYQNCLYGDIFIGLDDFGLILSPKSEFGGLAVWDNGDLNIGYGLTVKRFDIGLYMTPVKDRTAYGFGIGRAHFEARCDVSFFLSDAVDAEYFTVNVRCLKRKLDFVIIPRYTYGNYREPTEYQSHRGGLMVQRLILNEGFIYLAGDYTYHTVDNITDTTNAFAGLELPLSHLVLLRLGFRESFAMDNGFVETGMTVEPGICFRVREFNLDFHVNKDRLFDKELTFVNSFGVDLNFAKF
jgi:hypothetical protein